MQVEPFELAHRQEWDAFVMSQKESGVGHLSGVAQLEEVSKRATLRSFMVRAPNGDVVGLLPIFQVSRRVLRVLPLLKLVSGTHFPSGPLVSDQLGAKQRKEVLDLIMSTTADLARVVNADSVGMSLPGVLGDRRAIDVHGYYPLRQYGYRESNSIGLLLDLRLADAELLSGMKSNCRAAVRKCEREGGTFRLLTDRAEWLAAHSLAVQTLGSDAPSLRTLEVIWEEFLNVGHALAGLVEKDGQPASIAVVTCHGSSCYYWLGFNARPQALIGANNMVLWHLILLCKERGHSLFELGSLEFGGGKQSGISAFKASFGGTPFYGMGGAWQRRKAKRAAIELLSLGVSDLRRIAGRSA